MDENLPKFRPPLQAMREELEVLRIVVERLDAAGFPYMVSGSVAMNLYAQPRMTRDVDIVLELVPKDAARLAALFQTDFYCDPQDVREASERRGMFNLVHFKKAVKIDFIVRKELAYRREEFARRRLMPIDGFKVWVVAPEDLILSKLFWAKDSHSEFQLRDVSNILAAVTGLDWQYLEQWAKELEVEPLLAGVRT